jgi:CRP-like cAMP-binding protein
LLSAPQPASTGNRILDGLPAADLEKLWRDLEPAEFRYGQVLFEPDERMDWVYFPASGMLSLLTVLEDGEAVEAASAGNEGMADAQLFLGSNIASTRLIVQNDGRGYRIAADKFRAHLSRSDALRLLIGRYVSALVTLFAQSAACNRLHQVEHRCARWLLMMHDRANSDEFALTQETLAQMLGVRRASVSVAAASLQDLGYISYRHGRITVTERKGLESVSCECYAVIRRHFERMFDDQ